MNDVPAHFQLFKGKDDDWYWRLRAAGNGKIIAGGTEGYKNRADCIHGIRLVTAVGDTPHIWDMEREEYVSS